MQALQSFPKVLTSIEDVHKANAEEALAHYRASLKVFLSALTKELHALTAHYENTIAQLTAENQRLRNKQPAPQPKPRLPRTHSPFAECASPIRAAPSPAKPFRGIDLMQTARSTLLTPNRVGGLQEGPRFSSVLAKYQGCDGDKEFPLQLINPEPGEEEGQHSRYLMKASRKKQRQEELRHFLETGRKNLNATTDRFLNAIGRNQKDEEQEEIQSRREGSDSSHSGPKNETLNKSLGDLYESLDTSFYSKQARSQNRRKRQKQQQEAERKKQHDEELTKMLKDKSIKNLLSRLRDNVDNSAKRPPEVIKNSKLISCGSKAVRQPPAAKAEQPSLLKRSSKVLINPVPVDIVRKSQLCRRESVGSPLSPEKKPTSILKQSSTVLSRSISGISAIEFK